MSFSKAGSEFCCPLYRHSFQVYQDLGLVTTMIFQEELKASRLPLRRRQLLNHITDGMAHIRPQELCAEIPVLTTSYNGGYRTITYRALADAIMV